MKRTRKGFTLVELLIVVAIIGVLATMMTLSSGDAASKATAAKIASNFKIIRSAATLYAMASADAGPSPYYFSRKTSADYIGGESIKLARQFTLSSTDATHWYATYNFGNNIAVATAFTSTYSADLNMTGSDTTHATMRIY